MRIELEWDESGLPANVRLNFPRRKEFLVVCCPLSSNFILFVFYHIELMYAIFYRLLVLTKLLILLIFLIHVMELVTNNMFYTIAFGPSLPSCYANKSIF